MAQVSQVVVWRGDCVVDHLLVVRGGLVVVDEKGAASGGPLLRVEQSRRVRRGLG